MTQTTNVVATAAATVETSAVPRLITYSGVLKNAEGKTLTSITGMTFLLYKEEQGGAPLWLETQNVTPDKTGHYSVQLGATSAHGLPPDLFVSGEARWLAVQVVNDAEQERVLLVAVPYAMKAADAETIGGLPPSAFVLAAPPTNGMAANTTSGPIAQAPSSAPPPGSSDVTTTGGTTNTIPIFTTTTNIQSSILTQTAKTAINVGGRLNLPASGTATASKGFNSQPMDLVGSVFNSGTATAVPQTFQWQAEPVNNNKTTATGSLNLLYATGTATPAETGLKINNKGIFTFASGQTFPGTGTVSSVGSGPGLTGGPIKTTGTLSIALGGVTNAMLQNSSVTVAAGSDLVGGGTVPLGGSTSLSLDTTKVPLLVANNKFTGNQSINGSLGLTGSIALSSSGTGVTYPDGSTQETANLFESITTSGLVFPGSGVTNLLQLNIVVPTNGVVLATASGYCNINTGTSGVQWAYVIGQSASEGWTFPEPLVLFPSGSNVEQFPISGERVLPVSAGSNSIFLNVDNIGGTPLSSCGAQLTAIFTPAQLAAVKAGEKRRQATVRPLVAPSTSGVVGIPKR